MAANTPAPAEEAKSKKMFVVIIVFALVAAGAYMFMGKDADAKPKKPVAGEVVTLDPVYVNLAGGQYLKLGLALELNAEAEQEPNGAKALDLAISHFSQATASQVTQQREPMKKQLSKKIVDAYGDDVLGIYYTTYVMQ